MYLFSLRRRRSLSTNPFDDQEGTFYALVNNHGEYSLWPTFAEVPAGWKIALGDAEPGTQSGVPRDQALSFIEQHWTDLGSPQRGASTTG